MSNNRNPLIEEDKQKKDIIQALEALQKECDDNLKHLISQAKKESTELNSKVAILNNKFTSRTEDLQEACKSLANDSLEGDENSISDRLNREYNDVNNALFDLRSAFVIFDKDTIRHPDEELVKQLKTTVGHIGTLNDKYKAIKDYKVEITKKLSELNSSQQLNEINFDSIKIGNDSLLRKHQEMTKAANRPSNMINSALESKNLLFHHGETATKSANLVEHVDKFINNYAKGARETRVPGKK